MTTRNYFENLVAPHTIIPPSSGTVTLTDEMLTRSITLIITLHESLLEISPLTASLFGEYPVVLTPVFDLNQNWYWTSEWQKAEQDSRADYAAGRYEEFSSMEDFIDSLDD